MAGHSSIEKDHFVLPHSQQEHRTEREDRLEKEVVIIAGLLEKTSRKVKVHEEKLQALQTNLEDQEELFKQEIAEHRKAMDKFHVLLYEQNSKLEDYEQDAVSKTDHNSLVRILVICALFCSVIIAVMVYQLHGQKVKLEGYSTGIDIQLDKMMRQKLEVLLSKYKMESVKSEKSSVNVGNNNNQLKQWVQQQLKEESKKSEMNLRKKTDKLKEHVQQELHTKFDKIETSNVDLYRKTEHLKQLMQGQKNATIKIQDEFLALNGRLRNFVKVNVSSVEEVYILEHSLQRLYNQSLSLSSFKNGFVMTEFSAKRSVNGAWTSPPMYTHVGGYKFVFHVYARGTNGYKQGIFVIFQATSGEFDYHLQWPAKAHVSVQVVGPDGNSSEPIYRFLSWGNSIDPFFKAYFNTRKCSSTEAVYFLCHSELKHYLVRDSLRFKFSIVVS